MKNVNSNSGEVELEIATSSKFAKHQDKPGIKLYVLSMQLPIYINITRNINSIT